MPTGVYGEGVGAVGVRCDNINHTHPHTCTTYMHTCTMLTPPYHIPPHPHRAAIMEDQFIREHIAELLRNIRTQVLIKLIRPYTRMRISFISQVTSSASPWWPSLIPSSWWPSLIPSSPPPQELGIDVAEVEALLVSCILDNSINGRIDQVNQIMELDQEPQGGAR